MLTNQICFSDGIQWPGKTYSEGDASNALMQEKSWWVRIERQITVTYFLRYLSIHTEIYYPTHLFEELQRHFNQGHSRIFLPPLKFLLDTVIFLCKYPIPTISSTKTKSDPRYWSKTIVVTPFLLFFALSTQQDKNPSFVGFFLGRFWTFYNLCICLKSKKPIFVFIASWVCMVFLYTYWWRLFFWNIHTSLSYPTDKRF